MSGRPLRVVFEDGRAESPGSTGPSGPDALIRFSGHDGCLKLQGGGSSCVYRGYRGKRRKGIRRKEPGWTSGAGS